ncbi:MAG: cytochrome c oxidase subunit II [Porphyrobacter sp.]|jgi:cytochrome c oxidase subunit 2|nr:cytochrome c oxidase subunit II [Porphyrobacter sp.]
MHTRIKQASLALIAGALALAAPITATAQDAPAIAPVAAAPAPVVADAPLATPAAAPAAAADAAVAAPALPADYTPMTPTKGKGMPTSYQDDAVKSLTFQDQYTANGEYALWMHDAILLPVITIISLFVLGLLFWVILKFRAGANPVPSRVTHNTKLEFIWTIIPVLILVGIAFPSLKLLANQYETPPQDAVTVKAIGYQWYWGYAYPDHGDFEIVSNMLPQEEAVKRGEPFQLAVDNRMVVPAGVPLRIQTTASDVIHAFAVPSLWFKMDAVPGRLNEKLLVIKEPGVYYGQCSELCGSRHAYMPITVEALPPEDFAKWVRAQGGTMPGEGEAPAAEAPAQAAVAKPAAKLASAQ